MYTKYEEVIVVQKIINNYINKQQSDYKLTIKTVKAISNNLLLDINTQSIYNDINLLQSQIDMITFYKRNYEEALLISDELEKIISFYKIEKEKTSKMFDDLINQNPVYKRIISEILDELCIDGDIHIQGIENGLNEKVNDLKKDFESKKITKEQLIFYTHILTLIFKNIDNEKVYKKK